MAADLPPALRLPLLALGFLALLLGMAGGLSRLGIAGMPLPQAGAWHGVLMAGGFFGTLISLERAVALGSLWAYAAPLLAGSGAILMLAGFPASGAGSLLAASGIFVAASFAIWLRQRAFFSCVLLAAGACWAAGNVVLLGRGQAGAVAWWIAFFVLTIAGEQLEQSRLLPSRRGARLVFAAIAVLLAAGAAVSTALLAACLAAMALWLAVNDVARHAVKGRGLPRYVGASLLLGYAWLLVGALLYAGPLRDAALHAVLVGFVFSMVFGHAPVVFPAVLRIAVGYTPWLYLPLALLHLSVGVRVAGGLAGWHEATALGGAGNALAILSFILAMAWAAIAGRRRLAGAC